METFSENTVRCPTCRAEQEWSDVCRRCKCDLRLLRAAANVYLHNREQCLHELRAGRPRVALEHARACERLLPGADTPRLLAVCALLCEDWILLQLSLERAIPARRASE